LWQSVTPSQARTLFRHVFQQWGLPRRIQLDNGHPWGLNCGLPPDLGLWLLGLGVEVHWIPPGQPQKNGTVERDNGIMQMWADPKTCRTRGELKLRLQREALVQRERYPSIAGMPRMHAYPELRHSGRPYDPAAERRIWDLRHVDQFLAAGVHHRRVNARGFISLYGWSRGLGRAHRGKEVSVRFDPRRRAWVVSDYQGQELKRLAADELSRERILALNVGHRRTDKWANDRRKRCSNRG
jgi:hypothetical protein